MHNAAYTARLRTPRVLSTRLVSQVRLSSGSPRAGNASPEHFTKTGEKAQDPATFSSRSYEYSQSGGDDMVAEQGTASFTDPRDTEPLTQKTTAGKGNAVNPLEFSPAKMELSKHFEDTEVTNSEERKAGAKTGQGVTRKSKTVKKTELDLKPGR